MHDPWVAVDHPADCLAEMCCWELGTAVVASVDNAVVCCNFVVFAEALVG